VKTLLLLFPLSWLACSEYDLTHDDDALPSEAETPGPDPKPGDPDIEVSPSSIDFEFIPLNCDSNPEIVTITNAGDTDLTVEGVTLGGSDSYTFSFDISESDFVLEPGASRELSVWFSPPSTDPRVAEITVTSNDPDEPEVGVDLQGEGASGGIHEEVFVQEAHGAVDILWVIDNSGSMSDAIETVYDNFAAFINPFLSIDLDFHMGIITTDMNNPSQSGRLQGDPAVITPATPNPDVAFLNAVFQGDDGSGTEQGLGAIYAALSEPLVSTSNAGFLREDAHLVTIVVSDEDDDTSTQSPTSFVPWYLSLKSDPDLLSFSAFCGDEGWGCFEWVSWSSGMITAEAGDEYLDVIDDVGGVWASICSDDFTDALGLFSLEASGLSDTFVLSAVPTSVSEIDVEVNGAAVPYNDVDGWLFDWTLNAVIFYGTAFPGNNAVIEISYPFDGGC
jgi:hypothetical protein